MIIIDRFEGNFAVLETNEGMINVERNLISDNVKEGDVLVQNGKNYLVDAAATKARRADVRKKFNRLRRQKND